MRLARIGDQRVEQLDARQELERVGLVRLLAHRRGTRPGLRHLDALDALDPRERLADPLGRLIAEVFDDHVCDAVADLEAHDLEAEVALDHGRGVAGEVGVVGHGARGGGEHEQRSREQGASQVHAVRRGGRGTNALVRAA